MAERSNKLILDTKEMTEGFFEDARLLGIMAPVKDYQFCWHLNNTIGLSFRRNNELEIPLIRKGRNYFFRCMNTMNRAGFCPTTFITQSLMANTCCRNSSTWTFSG